MSKYSTLSSDYNVLELDNNGNIKSQIEIDDPRYGFMLDIMVKSFNDTHLENYLDDTDAKRYLGYPIKDKIASITMTRTRKLDEHGLPCIRITVESHPKTLRMTKKVKDFLDDYLSAQFSDGWGEGFLYPYNSFKTDDGTRLAIE